MGAGEAQLSESRTVGAQPVGDPQLRCEALFLEELGDVIMLGDGRPPSTAVSTGFLTFAAHDGFRRDQVFEAMSQVTGKGSCDSALLSRLLDEAPKAMADVVAAYGIPVDKVERGLRVRRATGKSGRDLLSGLETQYGKRDTVEDITGLMMEFSSTHGTALYAQLRKAVKASPKTVRKGIAPSPRCFAKNVFALVVDQRGELREIRIEEQCRDTLFADRKRVELPQLGSPGRSGPDGDRRGSEGSALVLEPGNAVVGDLVDGKPVTIAARAIILATGGLQGLFEFTDNPDTLTGDGHGMAAEAGAALVDIEFVPMWRAVGRSAASSGALRTRCRCYHRCGRCLLGEHYRHDCAMARSVSVNVPRHSSRICLPAGRRRDPPSIIPVAGVRSHC